MEKSRGQHRKEAMQQKSEEGVRMIRVRSAPATVWRRQERLDGQPAAVVVAQLGFEGARHMLSDRLPSARRERVVGLRMPAATAAAADQVSSEMAEKVLHLKETLKRLDLSGTRLSSLPTQLLEGMTKLERLDISRNRIQDLSPLCDQLSGLHGLVEMLAYSNSIRRLPANFRLFSNLRRLNLSSNSLTRSDGIDELRCLQVLILDANRLVSLGEHFFENLRRLEVLHVAQNRIATLPSSAFRNMRHLRNVDFSGNRLASIPPDLLQLHRMEVLNLSGNQISRVPTIQLKGMRRRSMNVDLSDNQIVRFPEQLLSLCRRIDLCRNVIKKIPVTVTKLCSEDDDKVIVIEDNPLTSPPADVCQCGTRAIIRYFKESSALMQNYEGLKMFVVGSSGQGKTSFVQTMIDDEPRLTGHDVDRTIVLDIFDHYIEVEEDDDEARTEEEEKETKEIEIEEVEKAEVEERVGKRLHLSIWDFSGNDRYLVPLYHFIHIPSICLIVFSMADYDDTKFDSLIGEWLNWVISKTNKVVLLLVATHSDMVSSVRKEEICRNVSLKIKKFLEDRAKFVDREIGRIERKPHIIPALSEHLKHCLSLKRGLETVVHQSVFAISSKTNDGFSQLVAAVKSMATDRSVYQHVLQRIPSLWDQVESYVEERGMSASFPVLSWKDYEKEVVERFGMKRILTQITKHLHNVGKLLWFSESPRLKEFVFLKPEWLLEVLKAIYRHDLVDAQFSADEYGFKSVGLGPNKFYRLKREFLSKGVLDKDYLRCILWPLSPNVDMNKQLLHLTTLLMNSFELGYIQQSGSAADDGSLTLTEIRRAIAPMAKTPVTEIQETGQQILRIHSNGTNQVVSGSMVVGCLVRVARPALLEEQIAALSDMPGIVVHFRFALYMPPGILDRLICQFLVSSDLNLTAVWRWETGLLAIRKGRPVCVFMDLQKLRIKHTTSHSVRLETRGDFKNVEKSYLEELWLVMLPLLSSVDSFLSQFSGVYVERRIECPNCHKASFIGQWQTPKQLQSVRSTVCEACHDSIDTAYLIQPKEKRVVDSFLQKIIAEQEKRNDLITTTVTPTSSSSLSAAVE